MYRRTIAATVVLAAGLAVTGCSSSDAGSDKPAVVGNAPSTPAAKAEERKPLTAADLAKALAENIPTVSTTVAYTETTDPNKRMGRPHQYLSKVQFRDSRIPEAGAAKDADGDKTDIAYGGTVEVFANDADAAAWAKSVDEMTQNLGGLLTPDYIYRSGRTVIRASSHLTPTQAKEYEAALGKIGG
ncbi:hypothetical protein [Streptomyces sp. NPDC059460]|uniref:hypothetical protein n=1 Tax=Streptomyces sp. NPDC059460 TaxID=3346840 RepID=UPI0036B0DECD